MAQPRGKRAMMLAAAVASLALVVAGCASGDGAGSGDSGGSGGSGGSGDGGGQEVFQIYGMDVPEVAELVDQLPQDVVDKGTLVFTTDAAGPPRTMIDENGDIVGVIPDLIHAVGATLGLDTEIEKNTFDAEVPGVESGRFDFTTGTGDFPTRREILDMIDYYKAGYLYLVQAGNPHGVSNDPLDQCGLRIGVLKGTTQESLVPELSDRCVAEGKEPIDLQTFSNVLLPVPLDAGRVDVVWENESTGFMVSNDDPDKFEVAGDPIFAAYLAFGVSKDRPELRDAMQETLQYLMDEGIYQAILDEWGVGELAMDYISLNSDVRADG
ncbi:ABC transporter substrate-binding protein [Microbacterium sp.]|uniref:ABC transporter substrate-binding protein n=1 Tax=Microbacterium sp. TaxID=51671 RepID=UPI003A8A8CE8